jgi:NADPH-dependent curcumin reductase CurA
MSPPTQTRQWILTNPPSSLPVLTGDNPTFTLRTKDLPPLTDGQLLVKLLYLSNDPAQRGWIAAGINPKRLYVPPIKQGTVMHARGLAEVVESKSDKFKKGDIVTASTGWSEYTILDAKTVQPAPKLPGGLARTHYLGALGFTGLTAYCGTTIVGEAKAEDTVVVSGAAGATGSMVIQIAKKILGCKRVVGIAGGKEKCKWVEEYLGADRCVDYKSESFHKDLKEATRVSEEKEYVDVFFDNVGGEILDFMLGRMAKHGRVVACGAISAYNSREPLKLAHYSDVISMRIQIRGFIVMDFMDKAGEVVGIFKKAISEGKLKVGEENEHVVEAGFEEVPKVWMKLFEGANTGKLITKIKG